MVEIDTAANATWLVRHAVASPRLRGRYLVPVGQLRPSAEVCPSLGSGSVRTATSRVAPLTTGHLSVGQLTLESTSGGQPGTGALPIGMAPLSIAPRYLTTVTTSALETTDFVADVRNVKQDPGPNVWGPPA